MTPAEAKVILQAYRPGTTDAADPEVAEALRSARQDPELGRWLQRHEAFQVALRDKLRKVRAPAALKEALLASRKVIPLRPWRQRPAVWGWAAAAAIVLLLGGVLLWRPPSPAVPDRFVHFRDRMAGYAQRQYGMDIETEDMTRLRDFLRRGGAPADYEIPPSLKQRSLTGGGVLKWRGNPVSMVCFDRGDGKMVFVFVMSRSALKDPPPPTALSAKLGSYATVSWSQGDKVYVLSGPDEPDFAAKYM